MTVLSYDIGLRAPAAPPKGTARVPSSKSEAIRTILLAARAEWLPDSSALSIGPLSEGHIGVDVERALGVARALGAGVERDGDFVRIRPRPADHHRTDRVELDVGESATLARFASAIAAFDPHCAETRIAGTGTLARRRSPALFNALALSSAEISFERVPDAWPVVVRRCDPTVIGSLVLNEPSSSQEVSALLMAGGGPDGRHRGVLVNGEIPSRPYLDLTARVMRRFGMMVSQYEKPQGGVADHGFGIRPAPLPPIEGEERRLELEPDASLAAVVLAAACLCDGEMSIGGLTPGTAQGDVRLVEHLVAFGCDAGLDVDGLFSRGLPTRGAEVDLAGEPDLAPVLAAIAADVALRLGATSRLAGLGTLQGKESDRLAGIAAGLEALGLSVQLAGREELAVGPPREARASGRVVLDAHGDHRIVYLQALLGLCAPDGLDLRTRDGSCVAKTWPTFWNDMESLGFAVVRGA